MTLGFWAEPPELGVHDWDGEGLGRNRHQWANPGPQIWTFKVGVHHYISKAGVE